MGDPTPWRVVSVRAVNTLTVSRIALADAAPG
jgi:hypothetical protein